MSSVKFLLIYLEVLYQNNPNPSRKPDGLYHWFDGDGMVHGVHINDGTATYRNRFVDTEGRSLR